MISTISVVWIERNNLWSFSLLPLSFLLWFHENGFYCATYCQFKGTCAQLYFIKIYFTFCMILLPELLRNVIMYMSARITRCIAENAHCVYCKRKLTESADGRAYWDIWVVATAPWQEYFDFRWHNFSCSPLVTVTRWHFLVWHPLPTRCCGSVRSFVCHGLSNYVIGDY